MTSRPIKVYIPAIAAMLLFAWSSVSAGRIGLSRLMSEYGSAASSLDSGRRALELNPNDAEAHHVFGQLCADNGDLAQALVHFEQATKLRPNDYFYWFELGRLQDENNDTKNSITSLKRATQLAPSYAQPHWLLGNVLLRADQTDEAFSELTLAARSDQTLFPQLVELAWGVFEGNVEQVMQVLSPQTGFERVAVARFLIKQDEVREALALFGGIKEVSADDRRDVVADLIEVNEYQAARDLADSTCAQSGLCNPGFEDTILTNEAGFGWQPTKLTQTVKVLADSTQPADGRRSLRVEYSGNFDESTAVVSQLAPVEPQRHYRLTWKSRTDGLASAGLPVVTAVDVADSRELKSSEPIAKGTTGWTSYSMEFETAPTTKAIKINLQRTACNVNPCPITGRAWFDQFTMSAQ
jgi:hypothetical protein